MKLKRAEILVAVLAAATISFSCGWFVHSRYDARPLRVEVQRPLPGPAVTAALPTPEAAATPALAPGEKVDLNTADAERLMLLPGIGAERAADIIAWREANGPFRIPEDLTRVEGIGEGTLAGLLEYVTVGGAQ